MEPDQTRVLILRKEDVTKLQYDNPPRAVYLWVDSSVGAKHLDFGMVELEPGQYPPEHSHAVAEEAMWVHRGRGTVRTDGQEFPVEEGMLVFAPPGVRHQFVNTGSEKMVVVYAYAPPGTEAQFQLRKKGSGGAISPADLPGPGTAAPSAKK